MRNSRSGHVNRYSDGRYCGCPATGVAAGPPGLGGQAGDVPPLLAPPPPLQVPPPPPPEPIPPPPPPEVPILIPPPVPKSCLFAGVEIGLLFPHVNNGLIAPVTIQPFGVGDTVTLPAAGLDSAAAPQITLGYRLRDDLGAILLTYRNLSSEGRVYVPNFDFAGDGIVESRLDINTVGLAYSTEEHPLGALDHALGNGAKLSSIYFDSYGQGQVIGQRDSDHFFGAGPMVAR